MSPNPMGASHRSAQARWPALRLLVLAAFAGPATAQSAPQANFTTNPSPAKGEELITVQFVDLGDVARAHDDVGVAREGAREKRSV